MRQDELDEKFKDLVQNDNSELNEQEQNSKEGIWSVIDLPQMARRIFPIWQVAAVVLLLISGWTSWVFNKKINQQKEIFVRLQNELLETRIALKIVQQEYEQLVFKNGVMENNNSILHDDQPEKVVKGSKREYLQKVVLVSDTVFIEKHIAPNEIIQLIRDTIFIEMPSKQSTRLVNFENEEEILQEKISKEKKSKMEFVFGKKKLEKPVKKSPFILFNEQIMAKKTNESKKRNVITIPINNN